jgi:hypothetical protein
MKFAIEYGEGMFGPKEAKERGAGRRVHNQVVNNWYS